MRQRTCSSLAYCCVCLSVYVFLSVSEGKIFSTVSNTTKIGMSLGCWCVCLSVYVCVSVCVSAQGEHVLNGITYEKDRVRLFNTGAYVCLCICFCLCLCARRTCSQRYCARQRSCSSLGHRRVCLSAYACVFVCVSARGEDVLNGITYDKDCDHLWVTGVCVCMCMHVFLSVSPCEEKMVSTVSHTKKIVSVSVLLVYVCLCMSVCLCLCARRTCSQRYYIRQRS